MDGRIIVLNERILKNLASNWTVKEMAESVDMSESHFQRLFKAEKGLSPSKYLRKLRFEKARELLEGRRYLRIQEICFGVGINDQTNFTRDFKKFYGTTPTQYRKNYWEKYDVKKASDQK